MKYNKPHRGFSPVNAIPKDFAAALKQGGLDDFFAGCTDAHRREYLKWIEEAKQPETRKIRIGLTVKMIAAESLQEAPLPNKIKSEADDFARPDLP
jgi:uncharacterized protein YdeI (YjbR/CyaY-like superfamily)